MSPVSVIAVETVFGEHAAAKKLAIHVLLSVGVRVTDVKTRYVL